MGPTLIHSSAASGRLFYFMPTQPSRWCSRCHTAHGARCGMALKDKRQTHDAQRGTARQRGYGPAHRKWRSLILMRDPFCLDCLQVGRVTVATDAHHIVKFTRGGEKYSMANGMGLCATCHAKRTAKGE